MTGRPLVIQTETLDDDAAAWLAERCRLERCAADDPAFEALLREAEALVVRTYTIVDEGLLARAPHLRAVARAGAGIDNIDLEACRRRRIAVLHTPDANTQAVVEYVFTLLLDALRPRVTLTEPVDSRQWNHLRAVTVGTRQLSECTLGILGMGRIGRRVAEVARAFGATVLATDLLPIPDAARHGATMVRVETLFERSSIVTLHIDGRPSNTGHVGAALLERLQPEAILLNTSRGSVVDAAALAAFLRDHPRARAILDVHDPEPITADSPLPGLHNVTLLPHLASRTDAAMRAMSWVVRDLWAVLDPAASGR